MPDDVRSTRLGRATITVINAGDIHARLSQWIDVTDDERASGDAALFAQIMRVPMQCIHVKLPELSVLVDAGRYEAAEDSLAPPDYRPPPGFLARLPDAGVRPDEVGHVVITHLHGDHFNGLTHERDGHDEPAFPNARHYVGRADWERPETQLALQNARSYESRTLRVLERRGLLELVEGNRELGHGVQIIAAPGESPGHQIVRVRSAGETLYCLGDLYHHPIEVDPPSRMVRWANADTNLASRRALMDAALAENALLVATHIAGMGRLARTAGGVAWIPVRTDSALS